MTGFWIPKEPQPTLLLPKSRMLKPYKKKTLAIGFSSRGRPSSGARAKNPKTQVYEEEEVKEIPVSPEHMWSTNLNSFSFHFA